MSKEELIKLLREYALSGDTEVAHGNADEALLKFIADDDIEAAYDGIKKWYA